MKHFKFTNFNNVLKDSDITVDYEGHKQITVD